MEELMIPKKLISTCKTCIQATRSAVRIEGTLPSFFGNKTELKQSDSLLSKLFKFTLWKMIQGIKMFRSDIKIGK
jgi:hypothetical protein